MELAETPLSLEESLGTESEPSAVDSQSSLMEDPVVFTLKDDISSNKVVIEPVIEKEEVLVLKNIYFVVLDFCC